MANNMDDLWEVEKRPADRVLEDQGERRDQGERDKERPAAALGGAQQEDDHDQQGAGAPKGEEQEEGAGALQGEEQQQGAAALPGEDLQVRFSLCLNKLLFVKHNTFIAPVVEALSFVVVI